MRLQLQLVTKTRDHEVAFSYSYLFLIWIYKRSYKHIRKRHECQQYIACLCLQRNISFFVLIERG